MAEQQRQLRAGRSPSDNRTWGEEHFHLHNLLGVLQWKYWYYCTVSFKILTVFFAGGHVEYASRCHPKLRELGRHVPGTVPVGLWVPKWGAWGAEVSQTTWSSNPSDPLSWGLVSLDWDYCAAETRPVKFKQCLPVWKPTGILPDTPPWCRKCDNHLRIQTSSLVKVTGMVMFNGPSIGSKGIK